MERAHVATQHRAAVGPVAPLMKASPMAPFRQFVRDLANGHLEVLAGSGHRVPVSLPDDPLERQADQLATHLMARSDGPAVAGLLAARTGITDEAGQQQEDPDVVDRVVDCAGGACGSSCEVNDERKTVDEAGRARPVGALRPTGPAPSTGPLGGTLARRFGPGQPPDDQVRQATEPQLGRDLSTVRMHPEGAHDLAAGLEARAFTVGQHIYFGRGEYNPGTREGLHVLLHELAHTGQAGEETIHRMPTVSNWRFANSGSPATDNCAPLAAGKTLGVDNHADGPASFTNMMELRANIANDEIGASYDIKRIKERSTWQRVGGAWLNLTHVGPGADDDSANDDECLTPSTSPGHIYSIDYPGFQSAAGLNPAATDAVYKATFNEWVEVKTGSTGATSALTFDWHSVAWLTRSGGTWSMKAARSEIEPGAVTVGTTAP
jgi:hypothetical protein